MTVPAPDGDTPDRPDRPTGPALSTGAHAVSWGAVAGATYYKVQARLNGGGWGTAERVTGTSRTFTRAGGDWDYQVRACNASTCSAWSETLTVLVTGTGLTIAPAPSPDGDYTVSWTGVRCTLDFGQGLSCRELQERTPDNRAWTMVSGIATTATSHGVTGKADGTYYYRLVRDQGGVQQVVAGPAAVTVSAPEPELTATISWDPETVNHGGSSTLSWSSTDATSCELDGSSTTLSGSREETNLTADRTSTLICTGDDDETASARATVTVRPAPAPTASVSWDPDTVDYGGSSTLTWGSTDATSCTINGATRATGGTWLATDHTATRTDTLVCTGPGGVSEPVSATLTVEPTAPAIPAPPRVAVGDTTATVSWTAPAANGSAITGYELRYKRTSATVWTPHSLGATQTSKALEGLTNDVEYEVQVRARNGVDWSDWSTPPTRFTPTASALPVLTLAVLPAMSEDGDYTVSWRAARCATVNGATVCRVLQEQVDGDDGWTVVTGVAEDATSKAFEDKRVGTYAYRLVTGAGDTLAVVAGPVSVEVKVPVPMELTGPAADAVTDSYTVSWNALTSAVHYELQARRDEGDWTVYNTGTARSKAFTALDAGVWDYRVRACNAAGCSDWSDTLTVTVPLPVPAGLTGPAAGAVMDPYTVRWNTVSGATYYELREWQDDGGQPAESDWSVYDTGTTTSKAFTGQASGSWDYRVRACNATGCSGWSDTLTVVVPGFNGVPAAPSDTDGADREHGHTHADVGRRDRGDGVQVARAPGHGRLDDPDGSRDDEQAVY